MTSKPAFAAQQRRNQLDELEAHITELWGHLNAATYRFLALIAEFDREKAYARHGLANTAQWLNWQCGIGPLAAREKVRVARARAVAGDRGLVRQRRDLVLESARDDARGDAGERVGARAHRAAWHRRAR
jgi:hypothetical protein